jgi:hypothetical protein
MKTFTAAFLTIISLLVPLAFLSLIVDFTFFQIIGMAVVSTITAGIVFLIFGLGGPSAIGGIILTLALIAWIDNFNYWMALGLLIGVISIGFSIGFLFIKLLDFYEKLSIFKDKNYKSLEKDFEVLEYRTTAKKPYKRKNTLEKILKEKNLYDKYRIVETNGGWIGMLKGYKTDSEVFADEINRLVSTRYDSYKNTFEITGNEVKSHDAGIHLRSFGEGKKPSQVSYQIYMYTTIHIDNDWYFFESAFDSNGKELELIYIDGDAIKNYYKSRNSALQEHYGISLTESELKEYQVHGELSFKLYGKKYPDGVKYSLTSQYIKDYLKAVNHILDKK